MRPFRSPLLRRLVATALVAALGVPLVPAASAQTARTDAIGDVLSDADAFEVALRAARAAEADPLAAFAEAYARATDGAVSAEAIERLLGAASMSGVVPAVTDEAVASAPATTLAAATVPAVPRLDAENATPDAAAPAADDVRAAPRATSARPRAP